jgi:hypothetical protein
VSTVTIDGTSSRRPGEGRLARLVTVALAGLFGAAAIYWIWRVEIGVPLELSVPVHMSDQGSPARPWAPWWVPVSILTPIAMLLWRLLAVRRNRILAWRGALAFALIVQLALPIALLCLELGATAQFYPMPSLQRVLTILPLMMTEAIGTAAIAAMMGGFIFVPVAALFGAANAGIGKRILKIESSRAKAIP